MSPLSLLMKSENVSMQTYFVLFKMRLPNRMRVSKRHSQSEHSARKRRPLAWHVYLSSGFVISQFLLSPDFLIEDSACYCMIVR